MTRDDVIRMAGEADILVRNYYDEPGATLQELSRFAALVAAAEREACAKVCDKVECGSYMMIEERQTANECAGKIRARGEENKS